MASTAYSDEPTLPLCDENGRYFSGVTPAPAKRLATRIFQLAMLPPSVANADAHLEQTLYEADSLGVTWSHPAARSGAGCTAIHVAAIAGRPAALRMLLDRAALGVDCRDDFGNTPLIAAACRGRAQCVALLLAAGADPNAKNHRGYSALAAAVDAAKPHCAAALTADPRWRPEGSPSPGEEKRRAKAKGEPFHWERGLAEQGWLKEPGMPSQTRR